MQAASEILKNKTTVTTEQLDKQSLSTTVTTEQLCKQIDVALVDKRHLICQDYKAWYCKWMLKHGVEAFIQLAAKAEAEGRNKQRYLSWLMKSW